jgi:hypothetical protein
MATDAPNAATSDQSAGSGVAGAAVGAASDGDGTAEGDGVTTGTAETDAPTDAGGGESLGRAVADGSLATPDAELRRAIAISAAMALRTMVPARTPMVTARRCSASQAETLDAKEGLPLRFMARSYVARLRNDCGAPATSTASRDRRRRFPLRASEDVVAADATPDDVRTFAGGRSILERGSPIRRPRHLEDGIGALDPLDAEAATEFAGNEIGVKPPEGDPEAVAVGSVERLPVSLETACALVGGHDRRLAQ